MNFVACATVACVLVSGCSRREMLMGPNSGSGSGSGQNGGGQYTNVELNVDWTELGHSPNGVTAMFYPKSGGAPITCLSSTVHTSLLSVREGVYDVVVFNNSPEEFASTEFRGMEVYKTAELFYTQKGANPEQLAVAKVKDFVVTKELQQLNVRPQNLYLDAVVRIEARGVNNIRFIKAHLTGLAGSYLLSTDTPKAGEEGFKTQTDSWKLKKKDGEYNTGTLTSSFMTLGLPEKGWREDMDAAPAEVMLHITMLLVDNKTVLEYTFPVGDMMKVWPLENKPAVYITLDNNGDYYPIDIKDVKPADGTSNGFEADVEDWGDDEEWNLGI